VKGFPYLLDRQAGSVLGKTQTQEVNITGVQEMQLFQDLPEPNDFLVSEFLEENSDLSLRSPHGVIVELVESLGYIELFIRINPDTTINGIRNSGGWLLEWRDRVHDWNKRRLELNWDDVGELRLFQHLDSLHENEGLSYQDIAILINSEIVEWIKKTLKDREAIIELEKRRPSGEFENWRHELVTLRISASYAIDNVRLILKTLGFPEEEIDEWIITFEGEVKDGKNEPFLKDEPIDRIKVRNWLKYRRQIHDKGV
jgi:hypothetical protein